MTTAKERIQRVFRKYEITAHTISMVTVIEKEGLQILAKHKIIPLKEWRELLKLLKDLESKLTTFSQDDLFRKIEEKLEELNK